MADYFYFAFLMLLGQLSPGPDMLLVLKNSLNHNLRAALLTITGITTGIIIHTTIALTGLTVLITESTAVYHLLRYLGAAYLAYLGGRLLLSLNASKAGSSELAAGDAPPPLSDAAAFTQGFATNILNPKIIVIISSILLMFLGAEATLSEKLSYGLILVVEAFTVWILIAILLQTDRAKRQFLRWRDPLNATFGILLIALALRTLLQ